MRDSRTPVISKFSALIIIVIFAVIGGAIISLSAETVPAGHVGVYDYFGVVEDKEYQPGFYFINPLATLHIISIQTQQYEYAEIRRTLTSEGLEVVADVSVTWRLEPDKASDVYKTVSGEYFDTLITPSFMGIFRDEVKKWTAEDIYTGQATQIQDDVQERLKEELATRGIMVESIWLRGIEFDEKVTTSISEKLIEKQKSEKMHYTVEIQQKEAQILVIQARGQAEANREISTSLTEQILTQRFIDAIKNNPNVIYVPTGSGGSGGMSMIMPSPVTPGKN